MKAATYLLLLLCQITGIALADAPNAVVFMYHHFGEKNYPSTNVRLEQFDAHLDYLQTAGYQILPLEEITRAIRYRLPLPKRAVAITMDDAYLSVYTAAYPRLKQRGWPFTVFVSTDAVDQRLPAFMTWGQMREMQQNGATFANHSSQHDTMIRLKSGETQAQWRTRIRQDILKAQSRILTELNVHPTLFAYPYGEYNRPLTEIVAVMGLTAFGQQSGAVGPYSDQQALPRFPMAEKFADIEEFRLKASSLAMPVIEVVPWDPELKNTTTPSMTVTLATSDANLDQLNCFVSGGEVVKPAWIDKERRQFMITATKPLKTGRSRYNCTAPSSHPGRYYWFSHLWIVP